MYLFKQLLSIIYLLQRILKMGFSNPLITIILIIGAYLLYTNVALSAQLDVSKENYEKLLDLNGIKKEDYKFLKEEYKDGMVYTSFCDINSPDFTIIEDPLNLNYAPLSSKNASTSPVTSF